MQLIKAVVLHGSVPVRHDVVADADPARILEANYNMREYKCCPVCGRAVTDHVTVISGVDALTGARSIAESMASGAANASNFWVEVSRE